MNDRPVILWLVVLTAEPEYFLPDKYLSFGLQCDLLKLLPIYSNCDIKVLQTEWRHSVRTATCCWGQVLIFSIGYFRMRSMQLENLHVFGRHNTSCLSFSKVCAIEGHSLLKSLFGYKRRNARFSSNLSVTWVDKKQSDSARELLLPLHPLWVVRICTEHHMNKIYVRKWWAIVNIKLFFLKH